MSETPPPDVETLPDADAGDPGGTGIDQQARLAEQAAEWERRRAARDEARREFNEARQHGLAARHARKLRRGRK